MDDLKGKAKESSPRKRGGFYEDILMRFKLVSLPRVSGGVSKEIYAQGTDADVFPA